MAWKPKTVAGKILKGAVIAGGSVLGLATGFGAVGGVIKGVGALKGASTGIAGLTKVFDKVGQSAVSLVTGTNKDERTLINQVKEETKAVLRKTELVDKLVKAGATITEAKAKVGITDNELKEYDGAPVMKMGIGDYFNNPYVLAGAALVALVFLPKLLKK